MTAREILIENSALVSGTAWDHLNNQVGGGYQTVILADGIEVDTDMQDVVVYVEMEADIEVEVDLQSPELELIMSVEVEI